MQTLSLHHISEEKPLHIITECDDTDACKSCGAGYWVGLTACEYCKTPAGSDSWHSTTQTDG